MGYVDVVTPTGDTVGVFTGTALPGDYVSVPAAGASGLLVSTGVILLGWSVYETTGAAPAVAQILDGGGAGSPVAGGISVPAGGQSGPSISSVGIRLPSGLYLSVVSGSLAGAIYYRHDPGR